MGGEARAKKLRYSAQRGAAQMEGRQVTPSTNNPMPSEIKAIKARQEEVTLEIERLQQEADELAVALRVLHRFSSVGKKPESKLGPPRPDGIRNQLEVG